MFMVYLEIGVHHWYAKAVTIGIQGIIYLSISIYCLILFAQKMYKLIKMKSIIIDGNEIKLSVEQEKLLYISTKYITLLSIAMISTWIALIFVISYSWLCAFQRIDCISSMEMGIHCTDSVINLICLYLQFPFAKNLYNKYCLFCSDCCLYMLTRRTFLT